jgi:DNA-binding Xre family transcriptional regulator
VVDRQNVLKNRISELAARADIKIPELADKIGMKAATLRVYTRHEREPKSNLAAKIAEALDCTINEVLGLQNNASDQIRPHLPEPTDTAIHPAKKKVATPIGKIPLFAEGNLTDPISFIDPPHWIVGGNQSYASFVPDGTGSTRFKTGDIVFVEPYLPVRNGDRVMVVAKKLDMTRLVYIATVTEGADRTTSYCDNANSSDAMMVTLAFDPDAVKSEHHRITGVHFQ